MHKAKHAFALRYKKINVMNNFSEVGHAKNVANLEDLISYCTGYGVAYNPSQTAIQLANLNTLKTNADAAIANVVSTFNAFKNATNDREIAFLPIKKLTTRIINALKASGVSEQTMKDAMTINRKLQGKLTKADAGKNAQPVVMQNMALPNNPTPVVTPISTSQQSYDSLIEHFSKLIDLLTSIIAYAPNEVDLTVASLNTTLTNMKTTNTAVITATTNVSNSRISRNALLYTAVTGLVDIAAEVKSYVKSVFGGTSAQYKQVSKLQFKKLK